MSLANLMATALPLNRKEKFYTGTVFPGIVCAEDFKHFNVFASLLPGSPSFKIDARPESSNIQFFTEYSPLHSWIGEAKARMLEAPASNETPDVAIVIEDPSGRTLIVLEAKVFDWVTGGALADQMRKQEPFIQSVRVSLGIERVFHAALIPDRLYQEFRSFPYHVITWNALRDAYGRVLTGNYFVGILGCALDAFDALRGRGQQQRGQNADGWLSGGEILRRLEAGSLDYRTVGRNRGLMGPEFSQDLTSGQWRDRQYQVSREPVPINRNWFGVDEFVQAVRDVAVAAPAPASQQAKSRMLGRDILQRYELGALHFKIVGRNRGLTGPEFAGDLRSGRWRTQSYEVSTSELPLNRNWFTVSEFVRSVNSDGRERQ